MPELDRSRLALIVVLAVVILGALAWGFGGQLALFWRMTAEETRLEQAVETRQARHDELAAELEYAQTDEYVEGWAREEARMAKPGETVVIPVAKATGEEPTPEAPPEQPSVLRDRPFWVRWWERLRELVGRP